LAAAGLAACGGDGDGGSRENVERLLDEAFKRPIRSADVAIQAQVDVDGLRSLRKPLRIEARGPYRENRGRLPSFDIDLKVGSTDGGQTVSTGRVSTGRRAYVKFEDTFYELPRTDVERANRDIRRDRRRQSALRGIGLEPRPWLIEPRARGDERIGSTQTTHVSGSLDARELLTDLNDFIKRSGSTLGATAGDAPEPLRPAEVARIARVVRNPGFDVYVGKRDRTIRRLSAHLRFDVPERDRAALGGLKGGTVRFSVEFSDVNGDQRVEAPARARPLADLTSQLGTLGALTGGLETELGRGTETTPAPRSGSRRQATAEDFERYADCLERARPDDTVALQRCADLLR
jgi:hypothetical protein